MKSLRVLAILIPLMLALVVSPVGAVGPLDGSYQLTVNAEGFDEPFTWYLVVLQNEQTGFALLDPDFGVWFWGFGTLDAQQHMSGTLFFSDSSDVGQFDLRFSGNTVSGTFTIPDSFLNLTVSGPKFF